MPEVRPLRPGDPTGLGGYRLTGRLGEGGQGTVYLAESASGQVAIKILHDRHTADQEARQRLLREVEAARTVPQFCTARVLDVGVAGERPYVVSEFIDGESLEEGVKIRGPLEPRSLERLAIGTASALVAIHHAGIVHRDFKPANVLLASDGPRVVDFGIARALDLITSSVSVVGTPPYMSPEQFSGAGVGTPSDMFSWAGTMVFAATGRIPFGQGAIAVVINRVLHAECDVSGLPGHLGAIVARCLAKAPEQRPTARDVLLHLVTGQAPGRATPVSEGELLDAAVDRIRESAPPSSPGLAGQPEAGPGARPLPGLQPISGAGVQAGSLPGSPPAPATAPPPLGSPATAPAAPRSTPTRRSVLIAAGLVVVPVAGAGATALGYRLLNPGSPGASPSPGSSAAGFSANPTPSSGPTSQPSPGGSPASSGTPTTGASGTPAAGTVVLNGPAVLRHGSDVMSVAVSADGRTVVSGAWDGKIRIWDVATGEMTGQLTDRKGYVEGLSISSDGRLLVSVGGVRDTRAQVWDITTRRKAGKAVLGSVFAEFSPDGAEFVTGSGYEWARLWKTANRGQVGGAMRNGVLAKGAAFSPDGRILAIAGWDNRVRLWRTSTGSAAGRPLTGHKEEVNTVIFLSSRLLASGGYDQVVRFWDVSTQRPSGSPLKGPASLISSIAFTPKGGLLAAGEDSGRVWLWDSNRRRLGEPLNTSGQVKQVAFGGDGRTLAVASGNEVQLWSITYPGTG